MLHRGKSHTVPPRSTTPEQEDQIRGMAARGETYRAIGEALGISAATVSRILSPPPGRVVPTTSSPVPPRRTATSHPRQTSSPVRVEELAASVEENVPRAAEQPITVSEDPHELARDDWLYYERLKMSLRCRADRELAKDNMKGYQLLLREARAVEERARELRPPAPPDPETDPTYRAEARKLATYLEALIAAAERGDPLPTRTLEHVEPVPLAS